MTSGSNSWVERYRPETWSDIQGNNTSLEKIKKWANNWERGDAPILLVGEPGTGKTTTANVLCNTQGWELNKINASSARKGEDLAEIAKQMQTTTIDGGYQLILLDEIDSWHKNVNKKPLYKALDNPRNPVMMTANDSYDVVRGIKSRCKNFGGNSYLKFNLSSSSRLAKLRDIAEAEDLDVSEGHLEKLAERKDLRSAINDLQIYNRSKNAPGADEREMDMNEWEAVDNIIRGEKDIGMNLAPNDMIYWLDENVTSHFRGLESLMAYRALANSDKWLGRANSGDYRWWKYAGELQEQVANLRITEAYDGYLDKDFPEWFRKKQHHAHDDSPESTLFQKLKDMEGGRFEFSGNYNHFRNVILPILRGLPDEDKYKIAMENRLEGDEMDVLGITEEGYENWRENSSKVETKSFTGGSALDW